MKLVSFPQHSGSSYAVPPIHHSICRNLCACERDPTLNNKGKKKQCFLFFSFLAFETVFCLIFFSSARCFESPLWMSVFLLLQKTIALRLIQNAATRFLRHFRCGNVWKKGRSQEVQTHAEFTAELPHKRTLIVSVRRCGLLLILPRFQGGPKMGLKDE